MLTQVLETLGITPEESATYSLLLESGPHTASQVAKLLRLPRPSIYGFLARLVQKGLVAETTTMEGVKLFTAEPPQKVSFLFDQEAERLAATQKEYEKLLPSLLSKVPTGSTVPSFQLFQGEAGVKHVLKDMLLYRNLPTYSFWPILTMLDALGSDFFRYLNKAQAGDAPSHQDTGG